MASKTGRPDLEGSLKRLEQIVEQLEGGDLPLEQALKLFEEGVRLLEVATSRLNAVEKQVRLLVRKNKGLVEEEFDPEPEEGKAP